eukprot:COSAG02_NODE_14766_length_1223_cov_1.740123_1_plen_338_part_10
MSGIYEDGPAVEPGGPPPSDSGLVVPEYGDEPSAPSMSMETEGDIALKPQVRIMGKEIKSLLGLAAAVFVGVVVITAAVTASSPAPPSGSEPVAQGAAVDPSPANRSVARPPPPPPPPMANGGTVASQHPDHGDPEQEDIVAFGVGSARRMDMLDRNAAPSYIYTGCFKDGTERDLGSVDVESEGIVTNIGGAASVRTCAQICQGYEHFAVQNQNQCYCDNEAAGSYGQDTSVPTGCNTPCASASLANQLGALMTTNPDCARAWTGACDTAAAAAGVSKPEMCGGVWRNQVYDMTNDEMADLMVDPAVTFVENGCYIDDEHRDLKGDVIHMGTDASQQ